MTTLDTGTEDLRAEIDPARFAQVLSNLLNNAVQYGARDRPIILHARGEPDTIELQVTNFGAVIPAEMLEQAVTNARSSRTCTWVPVRDSRSKSGRATQMVTARRSCAGTRTATAIRRLRTPPAVTSG